MAESIGELIEKLMITNIKLYFLQDTVADEEDNDKCADAARKVVIVNKQRAELKNEINKRLGDTAVEIKSYGNKEGKL